LVIALLALLVLALLAWAGYSLIEGKPSAQKTPRIDVPNLVGMGLDEARNEVGDDFDIEVEKSVDGERPVDTILDQNPDTGKAEKNSKISVTVIGRQVADVPGVVGSERAAAEQKLKDARFEVSVNERESSFDEDGKVVSQDPGGGEQVEVGSGVTITVGTGPSSVPVPGLYGNTPAQAKAVLEGAGLKLGTQSEDYSSDVAEGGIIYQDPAQRQNVEPGTAVDVTVSLGVKQVEVPEVYGLSVAAAQATLSGAGLNSTTFEVKGDEAAGTALSTNPRAGSLLDPGSTVTLYYSAGPPPVTTTTPDASTPPEPTAQPEPQEQPEQEAPAEPNQGTQNQGSQVQGSGGVEPAAKNTRQSGGFQGGNSGTGGDGSLGGSRGSTSGTGGDRKGRK
jgi:serine/threonine-protein kinase